MKKQYPYLYDNYFSTTRDLLEKRTVLQDIDNFVNQRQYIKITLLDWYEHPLREISGEVSEGSISKVASSPVRRTAELSIAIDGGSYDLMSLKSDFAINKKIYIEIGIKNDSNLYPDYPIFWFPQGTFFISSFSISANANSATVISLSLKDKMAMLNGDIGGHFPAAVVFDKMDTQLPDGTYMEQKVLIYQIIQELINHYGKEPLANIVIEDIPLRIRRIVQWGGQQPLYGIRNSGVSWNTDADRINWTFQLEQPLESEGVSYDTYYMNDDIGYVFDDFVYPEELSANAGETVTSVLDKIVTTLGNYEYFYDEFGTFHFREIKNYLNTTQGKTVLTEMNENDYLLEVNNDKSVFTFNDSSLLSSLTVNPVYENIKNDFIVQGMSEVGSESVTVPIRYHLVIDRKPEPIGKIKPWVIEDNSINIQNAEKNLEEKQAILSNYKRDYNDKTILVNSLKNTIIPNLLKQLDEATENLNKVLGAWLGYEDSYAAKKLSTEDFWELLKWNSSNNSSNKKFFKINHFHEKYQFIIGEEEKPIDIKYSFSEEEKNMKKPEDGSSYYQTFYTRWNITPPSFKSFKWEKPYYHYEDETGADHSFNWKNQAGWVSLENSDEEGVITKKPEYLKVFQCYTGNRPWICVNSKIVPLTSIFNETNTPTSNSTWEEFYNDGIIAQNTLIEKTTFWKKYNFNFQYQLYLRDNRIQENNNIKKLILDYYTDNWTDLDWRKPFVNDIRKKLKNRGEEFAFNEIDSQLMTQLENWCANNANWYIESSAVRFNSDDYYDNLAEKFFSTVILYQERRNELIAQITNKYIDLKNKQNELNELGNKNNGIIKQKQKDVDDALKTLKKEKKLKIVESETTRNYYGVYGDIEERTLICYKDPNYTSSEVLQLDFAYNVVQLPEVGDFNIIYRIIEDQKPNYYYWKNSTWQKFEVGFEFNEKHLYYATDWRTKLYLDGKLAKSMHNMSNFKGQLNDYYEELAAFWPQEYDLARQEFILTSEDKTNPNRYLGNHYFLDFIDVTSPTYGEYNIDNIGRRSHVVVDDKINCLFEPHINDVIILNNAGVSLNGSYGVDKEITLRNLREEAENNYYSWTQVDNEIFSELYTGGYKNSAYNQIMYDLYRQTVYQKQINLNSIPVFYLEPNSRITIQDPVTNVYGDYIIESISLTLGPGANMAITATEAVTQK